MLQVKQAFLTAKLTLKVHYNTLTLRLRSVTDRIKQPQGGSEIVKPS
jgi:hypothetical protein